MEKILIIVLLFLSACSHQSSAAASTPSAEMPSSSAPVIQSIDRAASESDSLTDEIIKDLLIRFRGILLYDYNCVIDDQTVFTDEDRDYHLVENYGSLEQLKNSVLSYTTEDIFNESLKLASFEEKDGKLYLSQPAMGLNAYSDNPSWETVDETTVAVLGQTGDGAEDGRKYIIHFGNEDGVWKVISYQCVNSQ
ncbi:hypothetical protein [Stecheria intestinalis]|uniref:hypothetical protein n=1 Tax=Stecheria intestinalis TaxID=2606630 RepID=UPI0023F44148|nr:hypothetical protein [Stecheria intestinalis]MDD5881265.1 hypothetical protein [Stecheria intestinalis]